MYKFSSCSTERISLTISLITEAVQKLRFSGGGNGETLTKPTHTLFFWKYPYQSFHHNLLTILKQAYFFSLSYLLATAVLKKSLYQINDRDERV